MQRVFAEPVIGRPIGFILGKPLDVVAWTANTKRTEQRSKRFTFIRWCATRGSNCAGISHSKQIQINLGWPGGRSVNLHLSEAVCCETFRDRAESVTRSADGAV